MTNALNLIGRTSDLFKDDIDNHNDELSSIVSSSTFLVIGGAGSIGQAVTKEIFQRNPKNQSLNIRLRRKQSTSRQR